MSAAHAALSDFARTRLRILGYDEELARILATQIVSPDRDVADRLRAIETVTRFGSVSVLGQALAQIADASFEASGRDGLSVVVAACRALAAGESFDVLKGVMRQETAALLVRAAAAEMLCVRHHDSEAETYLISCAERGDLQPALRFSAQQALSFALPPDRAIPFLASQASDASLPREYRQAAENRIADLGNVGHSVLRIFGARATPIGGFGLSEPAEGDESGRHSFNARGSS